MFYLSNKEDSKITSDEMDLLMSTGNNYDDEKEQNKEKKQEHDDNQNNDSKEEQKEDEVKEEENQEDNSKEEQKEDDSKEELKKDDSKDKEVEENQNEESIKDVRKDRKKKKSSKLLLFLMLILLGAVIFFLVDHKLNSKSNISKNDENLIVDYDKNDDKDIEDEDKVNDVDDSDNEGNDSLDNDLGMDSNQDLNSEDEDFLNIDTSENNLNLDEENNNLDSDSQNNMVSSDSKEKDKATNQTLEYRYYKLKPNETLFSLSMWYYNKKSKIDEIKKLNNITDVNAISTRKSLKLMPYKNNNMSSYAPKYCKIKKGETLFSISMKFYNEKRMIEAIKKLNNISNEKVNDISTGTTLIMP